MACAISSAIDAEERETPAWQCTSRCASVGGFAAESAAECEQLLDVDGRRNDRSRAFLDHVMKAELKFLMFAKSAEYLGHGPLGIEDGQDVTDARLAMSSEFIEAADSDAEGELHGGSRDRASSYKNVIAPRRWP